MKLSFTDGFSWRIAQMGFFFFFLLNEHDLSSTAQMAHPKVEAVVFVGTLGEIPKETPSNNEQ